MQELNSLQGATHANRSVRRGTKKGYKTTGTSGRKCSALLSRRDPLGSLLKMLVGTLPTASTRCCTTWKAQATPQGRLLFRLVLSEPDTDGNGVGLLPTARATDGTKGGRTKAGAEREMRRGKNKDLGMFSAIYGNCPLKPSFVEAHMGYPTGWTDLQRSETR